MNKKFAPQYLKVATVDRENYKIRFILSSGIVDRHGEIIDQKGWKLENYLKNPVVLWGHDQSKFPIGKMENMGILNDKLEGDVVFAYKENPEAAIAFELCAGGFLSAGSVGFMNVKWMYDDINDLLTLLENELFEFSIVNVPANPEAISKAIGDMQSKNVDKTVIEGVVKFQEAAKQKAEDRFKDLGEKVVEKKKEEAAEPEGDKVKAALEVLFNSDREVIKASVKELNNRLNGATEDKKESTVDATPSTTQGLKKGFSNKHINGLVRSLLSSKN